MLNDVGIKQIYYNYNKQYLVIAYNNSNIDIILSSGEVINVPAIKEVVMHKAKTINDITLATARYMLPLRLVTSFSTMRPSTSRRCVTMMSMSLRLPRWATSR